MLQTSNLTCQRDGRTLFAKLNMRLDKGDYLELTGPNGSGKSTLLRCMAGLFVDYDGDIRVSDYQYLGHRLGISQVLTAGENLIWMAGLVGRDTTAINETLERVGLAGFADVLCSQMSAGQQRRVALARLLLCEAQVWLLDEPLTALDSAGVKLIQSLVADQRLHGCVVCATHQSLECPDSMTQELGS